MNEIQKIFASPHPAYRTRREFLRRAGNGAGLLALAGLLGADGLLGSAAGSESTTNPNPLGDVASDECYLRQVRLMGDATYGKCD